MSPTFSLTVGDDSISMRLCLVRCKMISHLNWPLEGKRWVRGYLFTYLLMTMTWFWSVNLDDACAFSNKHRQYDPQGSHFCTVSHVLKLNSLVDISHPCHPYTYITYLSVFTAERGKMYSTAEFIHWQSPASSPVFVHTVYWRRKQKDHCFLKLFIFKTDLNLPPF